MMIRRVFYIVVVVSILVQVEFFLEWVMYDELSLLSTSTIFLSFLSFLVYSFFHFGLVFYSDILIINWLEKKLPWENNFTRRILTESLLTFVAAIIVTIPFTIFFNQLLIVPAFNLPTDGIRISVYYNVLYIFAINALFVITYEVVFLFGERKKYQLEWERANKENILSQFEALKNQVNPHFLFNSMNALSTLIQTDTKKAIQFINEFSRFFRYILELKDNVVVPLSEELDFIQAYISLEKIRFGDNLKIDIKIDEQNLLDYIPPFSLQQVIENAIKHNVISSEQPLEIVIESSGNCLYVKNNLQQRKEKVRSTKIGLMNLKKRYEYIHDQIPEFMVNGSYYIAKLPLINESQLN